MVALTPLVSSIQYILYLHTLEMDDWIFHWDNCLPLEVREDLCDVLHPGEVVAAVRAHKLLDERALNLRVFLLDGGDRRVELLTKY